jgi:hypothetical protein
MVARVLVHRSDSECWRIMRIDRAVIIKSLIRMGKKTHTSADLASRNRKEEASRYI